MKKLFTSILLSLTLAAGAGAQTISAFGDSQTDATYTASANRWRTILAGNLGQTITNYSHGGDQVGDQLPIVIARPSPGANDTSIIWLGTNHQKQGVDATKQGYFKEGLRALILQRALAVILTAASVSGETGSWSGTGLWPSFGRASTSVGSTKTFTVSGTAVYPTVLVVDSAGGAGTYEIKIDSGTAQAFNSTAAGITSPNGYPYSERAHRFAGLSSGAHTVELKMTGSSNFYVQWAGGNTQSVKPKVYVANIPRMSSASGLGYAAWGGSTANVQSYNADIAAMVAELVADGLDVTLVDLYSALNDTTDLHSADGLHISDAGHVKVAAAFHTAMTGGAPPPPPTVTYYQLYKGSDGIYYLDNSGTKTPTTVP
ncbi:MAG: SGNH/GDSL hydrolase family protein [Pseudomonadota bacterium]